MARTDNSTHISEGSGEPAYQALAAKLREAILSGEFPPHRRLPTEAELATRYNLSRQTVRQSFAQLVAESLIYRVRGRGTFATPSPGNSGSYVRSLGSVDELLAVSTDTEMEVIRPLERRGNIDAAARLQLRNNEVMEMTFRRHHDGEVVFFTQVDVPMWVGRRIKSMSALSVPGRRSRETVLEIVEREALEHPVVGAQQSVTAVAASPDIAPMIDLEDGDPVLRFDRVYFDRRGEPVEFAIMYANPVRYSYRLELRRSVRLDG